MASFFSRMMRWWTGEGLNTENPYNAAAYQMLGGNTANYDYDYRTYLEKGYGYNPDVYAIISQMADKTKSIPYYVKKVKDGRKFRELEQYRYATKGRSDVPQKIRERLMQAKAFEEIEREFPLEVPNPNQTWADIFALFKVYLKTTGNFYLYMVSPKEGANRGRPYLVYALPAHLVKIVLKPDADLLNGENPVSHYMLIEGSQYIEFPAEDVIHIKTPNPFFDFMGGHLYGLSPIRALLRNIESSNNALDNNVKTLKNSGIFGFITSADANAPFTAEQALQVKQKLHEMDNAQGRLSRIAGGSVPIQFTRLSLNTDELKPFEYLKHDQKTIANVLGWSDKLLNNDEGAKYDNVKEERKRVVTDNIYPDLLLLAEGLNKSFLPRFRGYEDCVIEWDVTELPEMQEDYAEMIGWMERAPLTPNEKRIALNYETLQVEGMDTVWIGSGMKRIDEAGISDEEIEKAFSL